MTTVHIPAIANSSQLLLAAQVLRALEHHDLPMHPRDYRDTTRWAQEELAALDTVVLSPLLWKLPATLCSVVENLLHDRGCPVWSIDLVAHPNVETVYSDLLARLRQGSR